MKKDYMHFQLFVEKFLINILLEKQYVGCNHQYIGYNHKPFINSEISKAIMT